MRAIWNAQGWDRRRRATLKGVPLSGIIVPGRKVRATASDSFGPLTFERFRTAYIDEFKRRLSSLRSRERVFLGEKVDGYDVELKLRRIGRRIRPRSNAFYGTASLLRNRFGAQD